MLIGFYISASPRRRVTQHLAARCPDALGGFVSAPHFDYAEDSKQFVQGYVSDGKTTECGVGKA
jgi:hypothetical protein